MDDQFIYYLKLGFYHVLSFESLDHILFISLLAIPFTFKSWKKILAWILFFSVGHIIPMLLSMTGRVNVDADLIELLIPMTIVITAIVNVLFSKRTDKTGWSAIVIALFFGVIHGFGFSSAINMLTAGEDARVLLFLEFSLGVFFAQIIIAAILLILGGFFRSVLYLKMPEWVLLASGIVIGLAVPILLDQIDNYWG